jgi:hypothetical protein
VSKEIRLTLMRCDEIEQRRTLNTDNPKTPKPQNTLINIYKIKRIITFEQYNFLVEMLNIEKVAF